MTDELNLIFPESKQITIKQKSFNVGKLSYGQVLKILTKIVKLINEGQLKLKDIKSVDGQNNTSDMMQILDLIGEDKVAEVISIILKTDDIKFCQSITVEDISEIVLAVCECNDIGKIIKNFTMANKRINNLQLNQKV